MKGILGKKIGMTQVFTTNGKLIPVTVVEIEPNVVTQIKTIEKDGYEAVQLGAQTVREKVSNKPKMGHTKKAGTEPKRFLREIRGVNISDYTLGQVLDASVFEAGEMVDVSGISKGKGYQGSIKRHNFSRGPMSHGSQYHRGVGSRGPMRPARVLKGMPLPGHMGNVATTVQNLEIVSIDLENNVILVKGNVPGPKKSLVVIKSAVKTNDKKDQRELVSYVEEIEVVEVENTDAVVEDVQTEEAVVEAEANTNE